MTTTYDVPTTITHEKLSRRIFDEMTAVLGALHSSHLDRHVGWEDVLDALHGATDEMVNGIVVQD